MRKIKKFIGRILILLLVIAVILGVVAVSVNSHIQTKEKDNIVAAITDNKDSLLSGELSTLKDFKADSIMVLGAGIKDKETPSPMLKDRLDTGIMLYNLGLAPKILLTGDNGTKEHNEIHVMLNYVKKAGVPEEDIFCDHAGFSTYDSLYRAKSIFKNKKVIVVTQTYHEYRALYIGERLGLKVLGVSSDQKRYAGQAVREIREVFARDKDFLKVITKPESEIGGEAIPINGNGIKTQGE